MGLALRPTLIRPPSFDYSSRQQRTSASATRERLARARAADDVVHTTSEHEKDLEASSQKVESSLRLAWLQASLKPPGRNRPALRLAQLAQCGTVMQILKASCS